LRSRSRTEAGAGLAEEEYVAGEEKNGNK